MLYLSIIINKYISILHAPDLIRYNQPEVFTLLTIIKQRKLNSKSNKISIMQGKFQKVGEYTFKITDVLGEGYSSTVYKGHKIKQKNDNAKIDEHVAIKKIKQQTLQSNINKKLLESQLETLQFIKGNQNILNLHDIIRDEENIHIITEVCNSDLDKKIKQRINFKTGQKYIKEIIKGFESLYTKEIVHRDLKPMNIFIDQKNSVKIGDFGFAIKAQDARKQTLYNIGSPLYMAPQTLHKNQYSHLTDIWAIGIIIYEIFTKKTPWKAKNEQQLIQNMKKYPIQDVLNKQKVAMPPAIKELVIKCLAYDKNERITPLELINYDFGNKTPKTPQKMNTFYKSENKMTTIKTKRSEVKNVKKSAFQVDSEFLMGNTKKKQTRLTSRLYKKQITLTPKKLNFQQKKEEKTLLQTKQKPRYLSKSSKQQQDHHLKANNSSYRQKSVIQTNQAPNKTSINFGTKIKQKAIKNKEDGDNKIKKSKSITFSAAKCISSELETADQKNVNQELADKLGVFIYVYQLLFKILEGIDGMKDKFGQFRVQRQRLFKCYSSIISKTISKIKDNRKMNILKISQKANQQFVNSVQFRKLFKTCNENQERYSKCQILKGYWKQSHQPNYQFSINATMSFLQKILTTINSQQSNQKQIEVIQYMLTAKNIMLILKKGISQDSQLFKQSKLKQLINQPYKLQKQQEILSQARNECGMTDIS